MDKTKTIKAKANVTGALWIDGLQVQFCEGKEVNWPAADAERAASSGVITLPETKKN